MQTGQVVTKYAGDTFEFEAKLKTARGITDDQWADADPTLVLIENESRQAVAGGAGPDAVLAIVADRDAQGDKLVTLENGTLPPAGSYLFRVSVDFTDDSRQTFPDEEAWNVLRVIEGPRP